MNNRLLISAVSASLLSSCATTGDPERYAISDLPGREAQIVDGFDAAVRKVSIDVEWELRSRPKGFGTCKVEVNNVPDPRTFERSIRTDCFGTSRFDAAVMEVARRANDLSIPRYRYIVSTPQYRGALNWKVRAGRVTIAYYMDVPADTPIAYGEPYEAEAIHERARFPKGQTPAGIDQQPAPQMPSQPDPQPAVEQSVEPAPAALNTPSASPVAMTSTEDDLRIYPASVPTPLAPIPLPQPAPVIEPAVVDRRLPAAPQVRIPPTPAPSLPRDEVFYEEAAPQVMAATYRHQAPVSVIPATYNAAASQPWPYVHVPPRVSIPAGPHVTSLDGWVTNHGKEGYTFALHFSQSPITSAAISRYNADHLLVAKDEVRTDKPYVLLMPPLATPELAIQEYQRVTGNLGAPPAFAWSLNELLTAGLR